MDRGFRRCNRSNLQTGAVAKKGVIGGFGRSRRPLCRRRFMGGRTVGPGGWASGWGWRARSVRNRGWWSEQAVDRSVGRVVGGGVRGRSGIEAGGRSRRSGRKSERVAGPCGQMPRPRNGEAARQQPNRFGWMSDFRRRNLSLSRNCSRISARSLSLSRISARSRNRSFNCNRNRCRVRGGSCGHSRRRYSASTNL